MDVGPGLFAALQGNPKRVGGGGLLIQVVALVANGCLSAVQVFWEIQRYEEERLANESTYWLFFELLWREFFRFVGRRFGNRLFIEGGIKGEESYDSQRDSLKLKNWRLGQTQDDFVNANMIELVLTGWMSNRGRQNAASYLIHELGQSWLAGARFSSAT